MSGRSSGGDGVLFDLSVPVHALTPVWPGESPFACTWSWAIARGDSVNVSTITTSPHAGTHADAPYHVDGAWGTAETLPLAAFSGPVSVVHASAGDGPLSLAGLGLDGPAGTHPRLLIRTGRSVADGAFPERWPWLGDDAVAALVDAGLVLLGTDAPSVDARDSRTLAVHRRLFGAGAVVLENLDLREVPAGRYHLDALPVRLAGVDAAPVRAVLRAPRTP